MGEADLELLKQLASETAVASEHGLMMIPISRRAPDGELISLSVADMPDANPRGQAVSVSIYFDVRGAHARFWEEFEGDGGRRIGTGEDLPYDFSESYRIQDIWSGHLVSEEGRPWRDFDTPEELIEFLADRLLQQD